MPIDPRKIDYFKALRLKQVGIALAGIWVFVFFAAVSATIYREIDGPTVRSTITANLNLASVNSTLSSNLDSALQANDVADAEIDWLKVELGNAQSDRAYLKKRIESYITIVPLVYIPPEPAENFNSAVTP